MKAKWELAKWELAKWDRRIWAVYDKVSRTFSDIGKGKRFCEKKAKELNELCPD